MQLVIAEKPSVGRDLARALEVRGSGRNAIAGADRVISWCVGHLVELDEPASYDARWKSWRMDTLPMLPQRFRLRPSASTMDQFQVVAALLKDPRFTEVVNACDAGREGELIFRYVYDLAQSRLPVRRLWISSMTDEAIRDGFARLAPGEKYDALGAAARCRSEADWLVGLNATRAVTVRHRNGENSPLYSIGRVQTPTLALLVAREHEIRAFVPRDYFELKGNFTTTKGETFTAGWTFRKLSRFSVRAAADHVLERTTAHGKASDPEGPVVEKVDQKRSREAPPLLFDLTTLQRTANRRFGLSAQGTLEIAQALYERHKVLTYPRTDARHLPGDMRGELPKIFRGLTQVSAYKGFVEPLLVELPKVGKRVFDDSKVSDHHAIVPTGKAPMGLSPQEEKIFDMVARRFIGAFFPDAEFAGTEAVIRVGPADAAPPPKSAEKIAAGDADDPMLAEAPPPPDRFVARGRVRLVPGWQEVAGFGDEPAEKKKGADDADAPEAATLPVLQPGDRLAGRFQVAAKQTKPPPRHSEATLLASMETAGKRIEDEELRAAMRDTGLGTPATRASIIETLFKRDYVVREGKALCPTPAGMALIGALPVKSLASPELTGQWEARLARMARGDGSRDAFMADIVGYVTEVVAAIRTAPVNAAMSQKGPPPESRTDQPAAKQKEAPVKKPAVKPKEKPEPAATALGCPKCKIGTLVTGKRGWGCSRWKEGCDLVIWFEVAGRRLTDAMLAEVVNKGKTRKGKWPGQPESGRLVLDLSAPREVGAARLERA